MTAATDPSFYIAQAVTATGIATASVIMVDTTATAVRIVPIKRALIVIGLTRHGHGTVALTAAIALAMAPPIEAAATC
jgi:hypothetical protein